MTQTVQGLDGAVAASDEHSRRLELVQQLLDRGVPVRALEALLPGWEQAIEAAVYPEA